MIELFALAYAVIGISVAAFLQRHYDEVTIGDLILGALIAATWPVVGFVVACKVAHETNFFGRVVWRRK